MPRATVTAPPPPPPPYYPHASLNSLPAWPLDIRLEIDGGVSAANIKKVAEAGVDMFVAGSALFKNPRNVEAYTATVNSMRSELAAAKVSKKIKA